MVLRGATASCITPSMPKKVACIRAARSFQNDDDVGQRRSFETPCGSAVGGSKPFGHPVPREDDDIVSYPRSPVDGRMSSRTGPLHCPRQETSSVTFHWSGDGVSSPSGPSEIPAMLPIRPDETHTSDALVEDSPTSPAGCFGPIPECVRTGPWCTLNRRVGRVTISADSEVHDSNGR